MQTFSRKNKGFKYLLTVIDVFSKYGWMIALKNKSGKAVAEALKSIDRKPQMLWVDKGKEFYNNNVKNLFKIYSTQNEEKSCVVERWNRTMKERMFKYFTANNTQKYIDILPTLVDHYNNALHSSIKMTPKEASKKENENRVFYNLYGIRMQNENKAKFKVDDRVRITRRKETFEKGYTQNWTREVFTVSKVLLTDPITYKIIDSNGEEIIGSFYQQELQKTIF